MAGKRKRKSGPMAGVPEKCAVVVALPEGATVPTLGPETLESQVDALYGAAPEDAPEDQPELLEGAGLEDRIEAVRHALHDYLGWRSGDDADWTLYPSVHETTTDSVFYRRGGEWWKAPYSYDESAGTATISGEPAKYAQVFVPAPVESAPAASTAPDAAGAAPAPIPISEGRRRRTAVLSEALVPESVDRAAGVIQVTLIKAGWSLNNRYYSPQTLRASVAKMEGVRAFANHPAAGDLPERSIQDQVGYYRGVTWEESSGSVKGEFKLVGASSVTEHILAWAEESIAAGTPLMGLSINAIGTTEVGEAEGRQGVLVTALEEFESVDVVTRPAAGGRFERLAASAAGSLENALLRHITIDQFREARPDLLATLRREHATVRQTEAVREATGALEGARTEAAAVAAEHQRVVDAAEALVRERDALLEGVRGSLQAAEERLAGYALAERAAGVLAEARIPFVFRPALLEQLCRISEAQWGGFLLAEARKLSLLAQAAPVRVAGAGPLGPTQRSTEAEYAVPTAQDGESFTQYALRTGATREGAATTGGRRN